jgi:single-strand DNA-binding protein
MSINKVMILGRLGTDPEIRYTPSGSAVCNFSVATSESWTDKNSGQKNEKTEWHRIVVWGKQAENCHKYLAKGRQAFIEGKLQTRSWDDKDGNKKYTTEIVSSNVQFIGGSPSTGDDASNYSSGDSNQYQSQNNSFSGSENMNIQPNDSFAADDIPF